MGKFIRKVSLVGVIAGFAAAVIGAPASAHVTVKPGEAVTAAYQTFAVSVPNERTVSTTGVKVIIPSAIQSATPTQKAGWNISIEKQGEGESAKTTSITWAGGEIKDGTRDEFTFSAKTPDSETELQWKAYQTYADGVVVAWDQKSEGGHGEGQNTSGPFSVTKVVSQTEQQKEIAEAHSAALGAQASMRMAFYAAISAVVLSLIAIYAITRKQK